MTGREEQWEIDDVNSSFAAFHPCFVFIMLESLIGRFLASYFGEYIEGLNSSHLQASIWNGEGLHDTFVSIIQSINNFHCVSFRYYCFALSGIFLFMQFS